MLRLPGPRFAVVDYKTNWLGPIGPDGPEPLTAAHYTPERLAAAMIDAHYPLQALLYSAALHRFLRWRLPGYDPQRHLGGVLYLFLRGMCGPDGPVVDGVPCGVFSWQPPAGAGRRSCPTCSTGSPVTGPVLLDDPHDARVGPLRGRRAGAFNAAGVLEPADVHVATPHRAARRRDRRRRAARAGAGRARGPARVGVRRPRRGARHGARRGRRARRRLRRCPGPSPRRGSAACAASPLVADGPDAPDGRPLRLVDGLLYLERYWRQEEVVRTELAARARRPADRRPRPAACRAGAGCSATRRPAGGPAAARRGGGRAAPGHGARRRSGHGQDHHRREDPRAAARTVPAPAPRIALAAPTGKAAARLQEAVRDAGVDDLPTASTLHRLLGWQPGRSRFRHDRYDRLPYDVIVVDETSMVSLTMMARLLDAVRPDARLVLVGDPDQLASVEAGAVLGDLARAPGRPEPHLDAALAALGLPGGVVNGVVTLDHVWRFRGAVAAFARAVQAGDADAAVALLRGGTDDLQFVETESAAAPEAVRADVVDAGIALAAAARRTTCRRRSPRWSATACCAGTGAAPTAWPGGAGRSSGGWPTRVPELGRARRVVPGTARARDGERLRHGPLQRRHRRRRRHPGRPAGRLPGPLRCSPRPGSRRWRPCTR